MNYQSKEMLLLKKQYDIDYLQHWRKTYGFAKYNTISMEEFIARLMLIPSKNIGFGWDNYATRLHYCDVCGNQFYRSRTNAVDAGFGFCDDCCIKLDF